MPAGRGGRGWGPIVASPAAPLTFETVTFSPASTAGVTTYGWDLDNDGFFDDADTPSASRSFSAPDYYTVRLRVNGSNWSSVYSLFLHVGNRAPVASLAYFPAAPEVGQPVNFVSTSQDPDGTLASLVWDLNGDGVFADATGATASYTFSKAGLSTVALRVVDSDGAEVVATQQVRVAEKPLQFLSPFPLVRVSGKLTRTGVRFTRLVVQHGRRRVELRCNGGGCKRHRETPTGETARRGGSAQLQAAPLRKFERALARVPCSRSS